MPCDAKKLRELAQTAESALFDIHNYMEENGDDFWYDVYSFRVRLRMLMNARITYHTGYKELGKAVGKKSKLCKNKTTPENKAFWEHVEKVAAEVRERKKK